MKYVLDTHIWLWVLASPEKIKPIAMRVLKDETSELWISAISIWEHFTLVRKGRITANSTPEIEVENVLRTFPLREAPLTINTIKLMNQVEVPHHDPADWLIAATARHLNAH